MRQLMSEMYQNRELIWALALKELRVRYKRSALGFLWALLHPLLMMIILTIVFSTIMRFPVRGGLSKPLNFLFFFVPLVLLLLFFRFPFHWTWLYMPVPLLALVLFTL